MSEIDQNLSNGFNRKVEEMLDNNLTADEILKSLEKDYSQQEINQFMNPTLFDEKEIDLNVEDAVEKLHGDTVRVTKAIDTVNLGAPLLQ